MFFVIVGSCFYWVILCSLFCFSDLDLSYGGSADGESGSDLGFSKWLESVRGKPGLWVLLTCLICGSF